VADTGHGMTDAVREHLFEPFFTTKPVGQGTGLGLAMVHGVVRRLKGHIRVDTAPDEGTAFHLYLPQLPLQEQCETRPSTEKTVGGRETILVVEDEIQVRRLAAAMLKRLSYRVVEAESAEEALRICSDAKAGIDLVLTDVVMPRISGPELARRLQESCPDIAAIYMSGYPQHEVQRRSGLADLTPMLRKPFTIESLDQAVRQALDGHDRAAAQTP
jgi:CheY-like chemotaxis protein